jgi:hypothetical protein
MQCRNSTVRCILNRWNVIVRNWLDKEDGRSCRAKTRAVGPQHHLLRSPKTDSLFDWAMPGATLKTPPAAVHSLPCMKEKVSYWGIPIFWIRACLVSSRIRESPHPSHGPDRTWTITQLNPYVLQRVITSLRLSLHRLLRWQVQISQPQLHSQLARVRRF